MKLEGFFGFMKAKLLKILWKIGSRAEGIISILKST
jgi:hypothetical protein